jgi:hypothetical protein
MGAKTGGRLAGGVTVSATVVVRVSVPPVAVTVTVEVPVGVVASVVMVRVVVHVGGQELLEKKAAPVGKPDALKETGTAVPETRVAVTVLVTLPPCTTETLPEFTREKSKGGGGNRDRGALVRAAALAGAREGVDRGRGRCDTL